MNQLNIYTDGASRGNPGPASVGVIIKNRKGEILGRWKKSIGVTTNNQAEYEALIYGLEKAKGLKAEEANCFLDSNLAVEQINRRYKIKDANLGRLFIKIWNLSQSFKKINFHYLPREKNKEADRLANQAFH
ncbi:MAG: ribonuclease H [Candidatus Nealsonbacteria bacterium CG_4_10_14_3_um_filter_36_16]|uniref:Ribonuclease H n=1 Tax=Candidatus Nealsonbacteria bacterium CG_4_10_14_3_um_filter_36_16 TaxID=1974685 RepID=A0A2M7MF02_9BACT|nr:ribonuclease HI family protein [Candidatus Kuenenbacteria bacterium]OIP76817.1 MAG: hypothetical protein AUK09_01000 [Parcubacteria group bacterium CG2_30_36_38]PIX88040.1 MAG: ribonuclease H [Candidatus Nealsonbacteria bacterium CG_4_10_14_3_um_filter_36_16]